MLRFLGVMFTVRDRAIFCTVFKTLSILVPLTTGGGQKLCTSRVVLPVADNIINLFHAAIRKYLRPK